MEVAPPPRVEPLVISGRFPCESSLSSPAIQHRKPRISSRAQPTASQPPFPRPPFQSICPKLEPPLVRSPVHRLSVAVADPSQETGLPAPGSVEARASMVLERGPQSPPNRLTRLPRLLLYPDPGNDDALVPIHSSRLAKKRLPRSVDDRSAEIPPKRQLKRRHRGTPKIQ